MKYTLYKPTIISDARLIMYRYVGGANNAPDYLSPRKFASVIKKMKPTQNSTRYGAKLPNAETIAATPALTDTATVKM